jgi:hypothetical protein
VRCAVSSMLLNTREVFDVQDRSSAYCAISCRFNSSAWSGVLVKIAFSVSDVIRASCIEKANSGHGTIPINGRPSYHMRSLICCVICVCAEFNNKQCIDRISSDNSQLLRHVMYTVSAVDICK